MAAFMKLKAEDASKAIAHSQFQPETDGYMKLGDIKGEGVRNRIGIRNPMESAIKEVGWWTVDGADFRGIQQDALTKGGQEGEELVSDYWSPTPSCSIDETCTPTCALGFADDALVQQVNGTTGYEMEAGMGISDNRFVSEVLEALTSFGQSSDPALDAAGGFQPREVAAVEIGEPPEPKLWLQMLG